MQKNEIFRRNYVVLSTSSIITALLSGLLAAAVWPKSRFFDNLIPYVDEIYLLTLIALFITVGTAFFYAQERSDSRMAAIRYTLAALLAPEVVLLVAMEMQIRFHPIVPVLSALYVLCLGLFIANKLLPIRIMPTNPSTSDPVKTHVIRKYFFVLVGAVVLFGYGYLGIHNIEKFSAVDEALWTFDRIPNFWRDMGEYDWRNARVSDKPGFPVAAISGFGLILENNPKDFKKATAGKPGWSASDFEGLNQKFRTPLFLMTILLLPLFYFTTKKLLGKNTARVFFILLATSPLILGNSRIINPDSILWIFVPLSLISFLLFLEKERPTQAYLAGFFLGLALLTKYTANILFPFFLILIPFAYIFRDQTTTFPEHLKKSFRSYAAVVIVALVTFFVLYPAVWEKPGRVFLGTIFSQAFISVWPLFAGIIIFLLFDLAIFRARISSAIVDFLKQFRNSLALLIVGVFSLSILAVALNTYAGMKFLNFEKILASPKSSHAFAGYPGIFLADFYPLVFGISAIAIMAIIVFAARMLLKKIPFSTEYRTALMLILFILIFYLGSAVTHVALIIRYQIVIFPIILLLAAISLGSALKKIRSSLWRDGLVVVLAGLLLFELVSAGPHFMSYASLLLPKSNYLDVKDMGTGSYEAAAYLNSLPDAGNLRIWTDKNGVCTFFEGNCFSSYNLEKLDGSNLDYLVLSAGRNNRSETMSYGKLLYGSSISDWYDSEKHVWKINLGDRPNNFVKIIPLKGNE